MSTTPLPSQPTLRYLGRRPGLGDREIVYLGPEALEVDHVDGNEVETRRVFFADVALVTFHQERAWLWWWLWFLGAVLGLVIWIWAWNAGPGGAHWLAFWLLFMPNLPFVIVLLYPQAVVTVFGRRSRAVMRWRFDHEKAHMIYNDLVRRVAEVQGAVESAVPDVSEDFIPAPPPAP